MYRKKVFGSIFLIGGAVLVLYAINIKHRIANAEQETGGFTGMIPFAPIEGIADSEIRGKIDQYKTIAQFLFFGGIGLVAVGAFTLAHKKKKRR